MKDLELFITIIINIIIIIIKLKKVVDPGILGSSLVWNLDLVNMVIRNVEDSEK